MNEFQFNKLLDNLNALSGNALEEELAFWDDQPIVVSLLEGEEYDDIGIGRTTARKVAQRVYDFKDDQGTLTESLERYADTDEIVTGYSLRQLYLDLNMLDSKSGNDQKQFLEGMFEDYAFPSVVSFAVLNDKSLGFGSSTLASAFGVKDSLPFYENVAAIIRDNEPITEPEVGKPFSPMLAVPESRGSPDSPIVAQMKIDGYRCIIHVEDGTARAFSRRQNEITESLPELDEIDWGNGEYILDAEVIASDEAYSSTSERIGKKRENVDRDNEMHFAVFDCVVYQGDVVSDSMFMDRFNMMQEYVMSLDDERVNPLTLYHDIDVAKDEALRSDKEGLIVKSLDAPYEFDKRSAEWQKRKFDAETVDVVVSDIIKGDKKHNDTMGKLSIESADGESLGHTGSGFSDAQRDDIWENQDDWIGRVIEVEARGLDENLRMPIFKRERGDDGRADNIERITEVMQDV